MMDLLGSIFHNPLTTIIIYSLVAVLGIIGLIKMLRNFKFLLQDSKLIIIEYCILILIQSMSIIILIYFAIKDFIKFLS